MFTTILIEKKIGKQTILRYNKDIDRIIIIITKLARPKHQYLLYIKHHAVCKKNGFLKCASFGSSNI